MKKRNAQWLSGNESFDNANRSLLLFSLLLPPSRVSPSFFPPSPASPLSFLSFFSLFSLFPFFFSPPSPPSFFPLCFLMGKSKGVPRCRGNTCNLCVGNGKNMVKGHVRRWTLKTIRILISVVKYGPGHYQPRMYLSLAPIYRQDLANIDAFPVYFFFPFSPFFFITFQKNMIHFWRFVSRHVFLIMIINI